VPRRHHRQPLQRVRLFPGGQPLKRPVEPFAGPRELARKCLRDLRTHFVATAADAGAERRSHIGGICAKLSAHAPERLCRDALQCAAPACMHCCHHTLALIDEENRHAIGRLHRQQQPGRARDGCIAPRRCSGQAARGLLRRSVEHADQIGMKLPQRDELHSGCAKRAEEFLAVGEHALARVPFGEAQVQHAPTLRAI
jgi:hypothetical protein